MVEKIAYLAGRLGTFPRKTLLQAPTPCHRLDLLSTAKAGGALVESLEKGAFSGEKVLFLHTGGRPAPFAEGATKG